MIANLRRLLSINILTAMKLLSQLKRTFLRFTIKTNNLKVNESALRIYCSYLILMIANDLSCTVKETIVF